MTDEPILRPGAVALITGASAGFGTAIAEALIAKGLRVICTARRKDRLDALATRLGDHCLPFALDVTDEAATANICQALPEDWRDIDILINNAGHDVGGRKRFEDGAMADWAAIIETNVTGLMRVSHGVIPAMAARGRGHVINLGSISGIGSYPEGSVYSASKFAVHGFSNSLRLDFAGSGIRVTEILPGTARTEFGTARWRGDADHASEFYDSFSAVLNADDVARCVVFALEQPPHVVISQLVVVPTSQW